MEIIMLLLGLAFASLGGFLLWDDTLLRLHANKGVGRIIAFKTTIGRQGKTRFWPIVSYQHQGKKHLLTARRKKDVLNKKLGDKVAIDIPTEDAAQIRLKIQLSITFSGLFLLAGLICTIAFFSIFEPDIYSVAIVAFVTLALSYQIASILRQEDATPQDNTRQMPGQNNSPSGENTSQHSHHQKKYLWAVVLGLSLSSLTTITGTYLNIEKWQFLQQAVTEKGIVTAYDRHTNAPIISFTPAQTRYPITFTDKARANISQLNVGSHVNVLYLSNTPQQAIIDKGFFHWARPAFFTLFSLIITTCSAILFKRLVLQTNTK